MPWRPLCEYPLHVDTKVYGSSGEHPKGQHTDPNRLRRFSLAATSLTTALRQAVAVRSGVSRVRVGSAPTAFTRAI